MSRIKRPGFLVISAGVGSSLLTLLGVAALLDNDCNIMGMHANYIIPVGAIMVGLVAGSGYGLAARLSGIKISKPLLITIVILQVLVYLEAENIRFKGLNLVHLDGSPVGFFEFYDANVQSMAWVKNGNAGQPLGLWGYAVNFLEVAGFALGGLALPAIFSSMAYCDRCQVYQKKSLLGILPAGLVPRKFKKTETEQETAFNSDLQAQFSKSLEQLKILNDALESGDSSAFRNKLTEFRVDSKTAKQLTLRLELEFSHCPDCFCGQLQPRLMANNAQPVNCSFPVQTIDPQISRDLVRSLIPS